VTGTVHDDAGSPLAGVGVRVRQTSSGSTNQLIVDSASWAPSLLEPRVASLLGGTTTQADGTFSVQYGALDEPDLEVVLTDHANRRLLPPVVFTGVTDQTKDAAVLVVPRSAFGWATSTGSFAPTDGSFVELLVDNHLAWSRIVDAVELATDKINFMLFYLDVGAERMSFATDPPQATGTGPTVGRTLEQALDAAADRGVVVRLVLNDFVPLPYPFDTADKVQDYFADSPAVQIRRFRRFPLAPMHAKVLVIDDDEAFVIGSPFVQDYYDDVGHSLHDPRHGEKRCSKGIKLPTHDVSAHVQGPAVWPLNETFRLHWNHVKPDGEEDLLASTAPAAVPGGVTTQLTRTLWGAGTFAGLPDGETSIFESYLRAIENARSYIYLENQYFTCREMVDALIGAMTATPTLQLIVLTNNKVDIPGYSTWQPQNITRLFKGLASAGALSRVGVFTRWSHEPPVVAGDPQRVGRNYVHSKVAVVDDAWATIGSANLDGVSLVASEHSMRTVVGAFVSDDASVRESDVSLVVYGQDAGGAAATDLPGQLRKQLWAEHLGFTSGAAHEPDPQAAELQTPPAAGGWLSLWNERADANRVAMRDADTPHASRVLIWPLRDNVTISGVDDPAKYLSALTIDTDDPDLGLKVAKTFDYYSFTKDAWA
jgi:phosphatidylserine/phosphatidylglycerophosphate/cardiolipin synthase-like enzyme